MKTNITKRNGQWIVKWGTGEITCTTLADAKQCVAMTRKADAEYAKQMVQLASI